MRVIIVSWYMVRKKLSMISTTSSASPSSPDPWKMNISTTLWSTNILPSFQTDPSNPASPTTLDVKQNTNNLDWFDSNDHVDIELANEKGGFIVKHVLFTLKSTVFPGNTVLRRYSDFHWLNDLLLKRYPTRLIPSLPPKKVNVDLQFLEQRKRGLIRFMNFISNHPVLKKDSTFITFISMQSEEFNILRKSNQEQAEEIVSSVSELVSVPSDFSSKLYIFEHKIQSIIDYYTELAAYLEIIVRRQDANSLGMIEFGKRLERLSEYNDCLETCNNCSGLNMGYMEIQTSFEKASNSVFENAKGNFMGLVEDLKVFRDLLISMQQMLARRHGLLDVIFYNLDL